MMNHHTNIENCNIKIVIASKTCNSYIEWIEAALEEHIEAAFLRKIIVTSRITNYILNFVKKGLTDVCVISQWLVLRKNN